MAIYVMVHDTREIIDGPVRRIVNETTGKDTSVWKEITIIGKKETVVITCFGNETNLKIQEG